MCNCSGPIKEWPYLCIYLQVHIPFPNSNSQGLLTSLSKYLFGWVSAQGITFQSGISKGCWHSEDTTGLLPLEAVLHVTTPFPEISAKPPLDAGSPCV